MGTPRLRNAGRVAGIGLLAATLALTGCANDLLHRQGEMREQLTHLYQEQILQSLAAMKAGAMPLMLSNGDIKQGIESNIGATFGVGDVDTVNTSQNPAGNDFDITIGDSDRDEVSFTMNAGVKGTASITTKIVADPKLYKLMQDFAEKRVSNTKPHGTVALHTIMFDPKGMAKRTFYIADESEARKELAVIFERFVTGKDPEKEKAKFASKHTMSVIAVNEDGVGERFVIYKAIVSPPMPAFGSGQFSTGGRTFTMLGYEKQGSAAESNSPAESRGRGTVWVGTTITGEGDVEVIRKELAKAQMIAVEFNPVPKETKESDRWDNLADAFINLPKSVEKLKP